jgi:hypothetical protein
MSAISPTKPTAPPSPPAWVPSPLYRMSVEKYEALTEERGYRRRSNYHVRQLLHLKIVASRERIGAHALELGRGSITLPARSAPAATRP